MTKPDKTEVKFPYVTVQLSGTDSNAGAIIGKVRRALRGGGATPEELDQYFTESTSGDWDNVIRTAMRWVNVE